MGSWLPLITPLHTRTSRTYLARMTDNKVQCMKIAKEYGFDYWDGDRRYGYGGYRYDGRYAVVAQALIKQYHLSPQARILDVGCGKAYLLYELKKLLPQAQIVGFDLSRHALAEAKPEVKEQLFIHHAQDPYPFGDQEFELVISLGTLHNLILPDLQAALKEIERVGKNKYIMVESYRDDQELFNLQCWALTCQSFFSHHEWIWLFEHLGYTGDYEFIYFE